MRYGALIIVIWMLAIPTAAVAKRFAPEKIEPIVIGDTRFEFPHFGHVSGFNQNGGAIHAVDVKTGRLLWRKRIYRIIYNPFLEGDVQDNFIAVALVVDGLIYVKNERGKRFVVDPKSGKVQRIRF